MQKEGNKIIYDWVSVTSKIHSTQGLIELLGLQKMTWELLKGAHGYHDRLYWSSISIHFNGRDDMGIWLEMSGQGCRAFETFGSGDYDAIFSEVLENPEEMNITRLDVAFDDHSGVLDIDEVCRDTEGGMFVSPFNAWKVTRGSEGSSVLLGSMKSEILIRIYDKAAERGFEDGRHWVRVELQLRRERAKGFLSVPRTWERNSPVFWRIIAGMCRSLTA